MKTTNSIALKQGASARIIAGAVSTVIKRIIRMEESPVVCGTKALDLIVSE